MTILTTAQYKLDKSTGYGYHTVGINLSPANEAAHTLRLYTLPTMCPMSGHCEQVCLNKTGMNVFDASAQARAQRTAFWVQDREAFLAQALQEIDKAAAKAARKGFKFAVRPNLLSDQRKLGVALALARPEIQFYDYTKLPLGGMPLPANYHLTFSASERSTPDEWEALMQRGTNVAIVFDTPRAHELPSWWTGPSGTRYPVIDGDIHDLRFLDPAGGTVVGLRFKRSAALRTEAVRVGFVQPGEEQLTYV